MPIETVSNRRLSAPIAKVEDAVDALEFRIKTRERQIEGLMKKPELTEKTRLWIDEETAYIRATRTLIESFHRSFEANLGMLPPADVGLEETILGALLLGFDYEIRINQNEYQRAGVVIAGYLKPDHFFSQANGEIYQAILDVHKKGTPVDMRTVVHHMRAGGKLELIGGAHVIAELTAAVSSAANIEFHARIVIEFAIKRQMIAMASELITAGYDPTSDCFEMLERAESLINEAIEWRKK